MTQPRLQLREALSWVAIAAVLAQVSGALMASFVRAMLARGGAAPAQLEHAPDVVVASLVASGLALLAIALYAPRVAGVPARAALGVRAAPASAFALAAIGIIALGPTGDWLTRAAAELFPRATLGVLPMINDVVLRAPLYLVWPAFALLPGVAEELIFRGLLQNAGGSARLRLTLSAVLFALFHIDPHHVAGVLPLGFFLAWVGARYGVLVTLCAHVLNNSVAIANVRFGQGSDEIAPPAWVLASWLVVVACVIALARKRAIDPADQPVAA